MTRSRTRRPRARQRRQIRAAKRAWPPECFELPDTPEEIERGVTPEVQAARDRYGVDVEHLDGKRPADGDLGVIPARLPKIEYRPLDK